MISNIPYSNKVFKIEGKHTPSLMSRSIDRRMEMADKRPTQDSKKKLDLNLFQKNLAVTSKEYGTDHAHVGSIHVSIGQLHLQNHDYAKALDSYLLGVKIYRAKYTQWRQTQEQGEYNEFTPKSLSLSRSHLPLNESSPYPCSEQFDGRGRMRKTIDKLDSKMNCNGIPEPYKNSSCFQTSVEVLSADYFIELMNLTGALTNMGFIYKRMSNFQDAIDCYLAVMDIHKCCLNHITTWNQDNAGYVSKNVQPIILELKISKTLRSMARIYSRHLKSIDGAVNCHQQLITLLLEIEDVEIPQSPKSVASMNIFNKRTGLENQRFKLQSIKLVNFDFYNIVKLTEQERIRIVVTSLNSIAHLYEQKAMGYYSQKINDSHSERFNAEPALAEERGNALSYFQESLDFLYSVKEFRYSTSITSLVYDEEKNCAKFTNVIDLRNDIVNTLTHMGRLHQKSNDWEKATQCFEQAHIHNKQIYFQSPQLKLVRSCNLLGKAYEWLARYDDSLDCYSHIYALQSKKKYDNCRDEEESIEYAHTLSNISNIWKRKGNLIESLKYNGLALDINRRRLEILEVKSYSNDFQCVELHNTIIGLLQNRGNLLLLKDPMELKAAINAYEETKNLQENLLGAEHPNVAMSLQILGDLNVKVNDLSRASGYYSKSQELYHKFGLGNNDPNALRNQEKLHDVNRRSKAALNAIDSPPSIEGTLKDEMNCKAKYLFNSNGLSKSGQAIDQNNEEFLTKFIPGDDSISKFTVQDGTIELQLKDNVGYSSLQSYMTKAVGKVAEATNTFFNGPSNSTPDKKFPPIMEIEYKYPKDLDSTYENDPPCSQSLEIENISNFNPETPLKGKKDNIVVFGEECDLNKNKRTGGFSLNDDTQVKGINQEHTNIHEPHISKSNSSDNDNDDIFAKMRVVTCDMDEDGLPFKELLEVEDGSPFKEKLKVENVKIEGNNQTCCSDHDTSPGGSSPGKANALRRHKLCIDSKSNSSDNDNDDILAKMRVVTCDMDGDGLPFKELLEVEDGSPFKEKRKVENVKMEGNNRKFCSDHDTSPGGSSSDKASALKRHKLCIEVKLRMSLDLVNNMKESSSSDDPELIKKMLDLAQLYVQTGDKDEAIAIYVDTLERKAAPGKNEQVLLTLMNLGDLYFERNDINNAIEKYLNARDLQIFLHSEDHPNVAKMLNCIGQTELKRNDFDMAMDYHQQALEIQRKNLARNEHNPDISQTLVYIGAVYYKERNSLSRIHANKTYEKFIESGMLGLIAFAHEERGEYVMAMQFYEESFQLQTNKPNDKLNLNEIARTLNRLGILSVKTGRYVEGREYHEQALKSLKKIPGVADIDLADTTVFLGVVEYHSGRLQHAMAIFEEVLPRQRSVLGSNHVRVAKSIYHIGVIHCILGNYDEATTKLSQALCIQSSTLQKDHPDILNTTLWLGKTYLKTGKLEFAYREFVKILELQEHIFGSEHPDVAETIHNLGEVNVAKEKFPTATKYFKKCLRMRIKLLGADNPAVAMTLDAIGNLHSKRR